ncbi:hypothetical protein F4779DRAFT_170139 [Xylariaceae sp. FL0662B]|nr:hypothetical protein F4779DRAFT_170139 [Xylariaceae sp. FL0662B]
MWERCDDPQPPAGQDPDVVGTGTFIAFAGSACVAVLALVFQYLFLYFPQGEVRSWVNPIDVLLLGGLRRVLGCLGIKFSWLNTRRQELKWRAAFEKFIMAVGDVQLAMGFALLVYGYVSLPEALSVYHWWLIVGLAWFAAVTNLATTSYLRTYFAKKPGERIWRIFLLVCFIVMLAYSMIPIVRIRELLANGHDDVQEMLAMNVLCYMPGHGPRFDVRSKSAVILLAIAAGVAAVLFAILWLCERPSSVIYKWRDHYRGEMQQSLLGDMITCIRCEQRYLLLVVRPVLAFWIVLRMYADFINSVLSEVFCSMVMFAWVTMRFIDILRLGSFETNRWTFGQIVALALFAAPFVSLASYVFCALVLGLIRRLRRIKMLNFKWLNLFRRKQAEPSENIVKTVDKSTQTSNPGGKGKEATEHSRIRRKNDPKTDEDDFMRVYRDTYKALPSPWFVIAVPLAGFSSLLHAVLLLVLPKVPGYPSTADVLWQTIFWYIVYQPLLIFAFILAGMIVEERVTRSSRMQCAYQGIAAITVILSTAAIFDTLYGLGGIPMSYIGIAALGLSLLIYLLYGFVAHPGPLAKGKGRRYPRDGDVEEGEPLLGPRRILPEYRFPVPKRKRWHGPSRRPQHSKKTSYGTMDSSETSAPARQRHSTELSR